MNMTERKPMDEVLKLLAADEKVFLLGCDGCPLGAGTGGAEHLDALEKELVGNGKSVSGRLFVDFLCNKALLGVKLGRVAGKLKGCSAIVVSACGVGVQAAAAMVDVRCVPALNTISLNGVQGIWPSAERCGQCGDCLLGVTGGICPITMCSKSLVNGTCGGTNKGKCEVSPKKDCGWHLIYQRLKALGRLDDLKRINPPRNHSLQDIPDRMRRSIWESLEVVKFPPPAGTGRPSPSRA